MEGITRAQLADMFGCSTALVKKYEDRFASWLTTPPGKKGVPVSKVFTEEDVRTLATIHAMRQSGVSYNNIEDQLDAALASGQYDVVMEEEGVEDTKSERFVPDEDPGGALVPAGQYALVLGRYQAKEEEVERLREELDQERQARLEAAERAAASSATSEERDRLLERLDKLEAQLEEERTKSWWRRLRGG